MTDLTTPTTRRRTTFKPRPQQWPRQKTRTPERAPSRAEIAWAAGIFEATGSILADRLVVKSADETVIALLFQRLGGRVNGPYDSYWLWTLTGDRARWFVGAAGHWFGPRRCDLLAAKGWSVPRQTVHTEH